MSKCQKVKNKCHRLLTANDWPQLMLRLCILPLSKLQECTSKRSVSSTSTWESHCVTAIRSDFYWRSLKPSERRFAPQAQADHTTLAICFWANLSQIQRHVKNLNSLVVPPTPSFLFFVVSGCHSHINFSSTWMHGALCIMCCPRLPSSFDMDAFAHIWYVFSCLLKWFHMIHFSSWSVREPASLWASFANRSWPCRRTESAT